MIHIFLLVFGIYWVGVGIVICVQLFCLSLKTGKGIWWVTIPGILVVALLGMNFVCHMLHLPGQVIPHQAQIINAINGTLQVAMVPLILMALYKTWQKKRTEAILRSKDTLPIK